MAGLIGMPRASWRRQPPGPATVEMRYFPGANLMAAQLGDHHSEGLLGPQLRNLSAPVESTPSGRGPRFSGVAGSSYAYGTNGQTLSRFTVIQYVVAIPPVDTTVRFLSVFRDNFSDSDIIPRFGIATNSTTNLRFYRDLYPTPGEYNDIGVYAPLIPNMIIASNTDSNSIIWNNKVRYSYGNNDSAAKSFFVIGRGNTSTFFSILYTILLDNFTATEGFANDLTDNPWIIWRSLKSRIYSFPTSVATPGVPTSLLNQNLAATSFRSAWTAPA